MGAYGSPDLSQHNVINENIMYCEKCGTAVNKNYKFCPTCGNKKRKNKWLIGILIAIFAIPLLLINLLLIFSFIKTVIELW